MFDILEEKSKTLSKLGSFYYSTITNKDVNLAHRLSHVAYNSGLFHQFRNIYNNVSNQQYTDLINKVITFQDSDIKFGTFEIGNKAANYIPDLDQITLLPDELQGNVSKLRLDDDVSLAYILNVPKNIYIKIIRLDDGTTLFNGLNFKSKYGQIILRTNPIHLFKGMQFFVLSYQQRDRNILCYPLGVQDVYGSINHIIDYYRNNQSLRAFKKALYQAVGIPVVEDYCTIMSIVNLTSGVSYIASSGVCYDADFPHQQLQVGDSLTKGTIIGGEEILKIYLPGDEIPQSIKSVKLNNLSIAGGTDLIIPNSVDRLFIDNIFQPNNFIYGDGAQYYINYINSIGNTTKPTELVPDSMNRVEFLRNVLAPSRCVIIDMDKENIPYDMAMKLKSFIIDHSPIGAVFAFSNETFIPVSSAVCVACFGNESLPAKSFITDSFYLNNVPDTLCELSNGDTLFFDSSVANFWAGATDGSIENTWYNTKAVTQLNEALNLGDNGFTNEDFSQGSFIYYSATGSQGSTSTVTLDISSTAKVGDKIVIMASVASRQQANRGFQITGISDQDIKLSYAGVFGDGFSHVNTNRVEYNSNNTENWSPEKENVNIFMAEGTLTSTQLVLSQPNTTKNGWQFISYRTMTQDNS